MNPLPQGNVIRWVQAISPTHWVGCGGYGTFIRTTNAGTTWDVFANAGGTDFSTGQGKSLWDGWFFNETTGLVCGTRGWIARTTNGGTNWDSIGSSSSLNITFMGMHFINSTTGFIGASGGVVKKTTNAGLNWTSLSSITNSVSKVFALDENNIFLVCSDVLVKSSNGGVNWVYNSTGLSNNSDVYFIDYNTGFISANDGVVKITTNSGTNWTNTQLSSTFNLYSLYCTASPFKLYAIGDTGKIFISTDTGNNWSSLPVLVPGQHTSSWWAMDISGSTMILAGGNGIFNSSTNNGTTWISKTYRVGGGTLYDIWPSRTSDKVWAVGAPRWIGNSFDQVLYSSNAGSNFQTQTVNGSYATYNSICMIDDNTGYICGNFGAIRKTTNGGDTWDSLITPIPSTQLLSKVQFINASTGWVFSNSANSGGCIWKTLNAGSNWIQQSLNYEYFDQVVGAACMVNANTGYCSEYPDGNIFKTTNGGTNWLQVAPSFYNGFLPVDIYMADDNSGYCCGSFGVYKTTNGWINHDSVVTPTPMFDFMHWTDMQTGFGMSGYGLTSKTTNGGQSWTTYRTSLYQYTMTKISTKTPDIAYVTGLGGTIMKLNLNGSSLASVSGTVRYSDDNLPVTSGMVKAIKYDSLLNKITVIDSAQIQSNGAYTIYNLPPVEMDFMAFEDDELDYAPTYYDTTIYWQHAITLIPTTNLTNIDIKVKRINNSGGGMRHISGTITAETDVVGLSDAFIYAKIENQFKNYDISGANGYFYVDSLPDGSYSLVVDRMGYLPYTLNISLTGSSIDNLIITLIRYTGLTNISNELPLNYSLSNYPNPFNPSTNIIFDIPVQDNVKLSIYNLLGQEVKVLVNEKLNAGKYKLEFNASDFASGIYFYKLETENFTETKKMVLLK